MFKSIEHIWNEGYQDCLIIIDDDFSETFVGHDYFTITGIVVGIIKCYSSKNLNVAKNLLLYMKYQARRGFEIKNQISCYRYNIREFNYYLPEIQKYLNLL